MTIVIPGMVTLSLISLFYCSMLPETGRKARMQAFEQQYIAHRGFHDNQSECPENSLPAFERAIEMGYGIELDVQLTKDGEMVVVHDEEIDRVSDGSGFVKDYTLAELKNLNFNKTHPEYQNVKIPTLREVYEALKPTGMTINVELKTGIFWYKDLEKKVLELTKEMEMEDRVIYSSFNHYIF